MKAWAADTQQGKIHMILKESDTQALNKDAQWMMCEYKNMKKNRPVQSQMKDYNDDCLNGLDYNFQIVTPNKLLYKK